MGKCSRMENLRARLGRSRAARSAARGALLIALLALPSTSASASPELPAPSFAHPSAPPAEADTKEADTRIPGHYIVVFKDTVEYPASLAETQTEARDGDLGFVYRYGLKGYSAELDKAAVEALRNDPRVKYVTPDHKIELEAQTVPTGIERIGATENAIADIDDEDDARVNVDVAVIDTGVDYTHSDLNVYKRANCIPAGEDWSDPVEGIAKSCAENSGADGVGHGTHVAGTVAAIDNGEGVTGVAPGARIWAARVLSNEGVGTESWVTAGVEWVTAHASEIEVANMSLGGGYEENQPALEEAIDKSVEAGVVYAVAAGNSGIKAFRFSPAKNPNVITVSALADYDGKLGGQSKALINGGPEVCERPDEYFNFGDDDRLAWFSNYGPPVAVAAPGVCILSTWPEGTYAYSSGTSMASPHVAGAAALLASESNPGSKKDVEAIRQQIIDEGNYSWVNIRSWFSQEWQPEATFPLVDVSPPGAATYTSTPSEVNPTEAKLNGGANPFGTATSYRFEYGPTTSYGTSIPSSPKTIGSGGEDLFLTETAKGLKPFTTYHYRLTTINEATKAETHGEDRTFTPGLVISAPASSIGSHRARLSARINPSGVETSYHFEWGESTAYGEVAPASPKSIGSGTADVDVFEPIEGLRAKTEYHYRVVVTSKEGGVKYGQDETFTTSDAEFVAKEYPARLKGEIASINFFHPEKTFEIYDTLSETYLFNCDSFSFTSSLLWGPSESFTAQVQEPTCYKISGGLKDNVPVEMNGCELEFYPSSVDIGGPNCTAIIAKRSGCTIEIGPQRGIGVLPEVSGVAKPAFPMLLRGGRDVRFTVNGGGCGPLSEGTRATGVMEGGWAVSGFRENGTDELDARRYAPRPAATGNAVEVQAKAATLTGKAYRHFSTNEAEARYLPEIEYSFEYGATSGYGATTAWKTLPLVEETEELEIGEGENSEEVSGKIEDLDPGSTLHYRLRVRDEFGTFLGNDETVTTLSLCKGTEGKCEWKTQATPDLKTSENQLAGVSCASGSICMAVGSDTLVNRSIAQLWNGSAWSTQVETGVKNGSPNGVSCPTTTWCMAVGGVGSGNSKAWQLKEEGGKWTASFATPPTPSGGSNAQLRSVSCISSSACTAVGSYYAEGESNDKLLVERWDGSSWSTQSAAALSESTLIDETAVSCASSTACVMVGTHRKGSTPTAFAQSWNGTSWSALSPQNPGANATRINNISCPSTAYCIAVGGYKETIGQAEKPLAESWNGISWSTMSVPAPAEATNGSRLRGISCTSTAVCTASGSYHDGGGSVEERTLVEAWNGTSWSIQSTPNPSTTLSKLNQVSCSSASACTAVGAMQPAADLVDGETASLAERWNGSEWSTQAPPDRATSEHSLAEVSCASATMCIAVGSYPLIEKGIAQLWNGSSWSLQVNALANKQGYPADVSCPTTIWCMAVGSMPELGAGGGKAWLLKEEGGKWTPTFQAPSLPSGGSKGELRGVSCTSTSACTAVGFYYDEGESKYKPLVERWDGSSWSIQAAPSPAEGSAVSAMLSVSCASSTSCTTVGEVNPDPALSPQRV